MRDRTGIERIDAAIEEFLASTITGSYDDVHEGQSAAVASFTLDRTRDDDDQPAAGWCGAATRAFIAVLADHGIDQGNTDDDISGQVESHGYTDMPFGPLDEFGHPENPELSPSHCANIALDGDYAYLIDFTASQYGYDALPMVRRTSRENGRRMIRMGDLMPLSEWELDW